MDRPHEHPSRGEAGTHFVAFTGAPVPRYTQQFAMHRPTTPWILLAGLVSLAITIWLFHPTLGCYGECFIDYAAIHNPALAGLETNDARLNSWILAWVQHALLHEPLALFDGNTFYPARNGLAGSEHLIGMALQTWPFAAFTDSPVAVHQAGILLATLLTGWTTFSLTFHLCGSAVASFFACVMAMLMPWRWMEFSHLQLLSAHWFPLVWLWFGRSLGGGLSRPGVVFLAAILTLQLLTSFYLAYFLTFSLAIITIVFVVMGRVRIGGVKQTALACAVPYGVFLLCALPYVMRDSADGLSDVALVLTSMPWASVWTGLCPQFLLDALDTTRISANYSIPGLVLIPAAAAPLMLRATASRDERNDPMPFVIALAVIALASVILSMGWSVVVDGKQVTLPGGWAARWVPGYENIRYPIRWAIVIGLALPPLAGVTYSCCMEVARKRMPRPTVSAISAGVLIVMCGATIHGVAPLQAKQAWTESERHPYEHLAGLGAGTVVSLPWSGRNEGGTESESLYALLSTLHWKQTLNGFTAYRPLSYAYLLDLARGLPDAKRLNDLVRFTGLRWIVRHRRRFEPRAKAWDSLVASGALRQEYNDNGATIYEVMQRENSNSWRDALLDREHRSRTVTGLARTPITLDSFGTLEVGVLSNYVYWGGHSLPVVANVRIGNPSKLAWPGLDPDPEGLVHLRTVFKHRASGAVVSDLLSPIHADIPPGSSTLVRTVLFPPARPSTYEAHFDLIQLIDGIEMPLATPGVVSVLTARRFGGRR